MIGVWLSHFRRNVHSSTGGQVQRLRDLQVTLYGFPTCPFCSKTDAVLQYFALPHHSVVVNPFHKRELAFSRDYKKVPIMVVQHGEQRQQINGSTEIVQAVAHLAKKFGLPNTQSLTEEQSVMANVWCRWADDKLVKLLPVNLYRSLSDSILVFNNISRSWTPWQRFFFRYPGAVALSFAQKKMKKRAGLKPDANERHALMDEISLWEDAVAGGPFNGGSRPLLSDMLVYGYLRTVISYPLGQELLSRPRLAHWYHSVEDFLGQVPPVDPDTTVAQDPCE